MERERITLTEEELEDFDFTGGYPGTTWHLRDEVYEYVTEVRTDASSDGPSWDIVVKRESDGKLFKWNCWETSYKYYMSSGDNYMEETFEEKVVQINYV